MYTFLIILHVIVAILLVVVILMQSSKGGGLAGAFGGGGGGAGSQALFGGRGASSFLQKLTVGLAVVFMLLALSINLIGDSSSAQRSVVQEAAEQQELTPGTPLPKPSGAQDGSQGLAPVGNEGTPVPQQNSNSNTEGN